MFILTLQFTTPDTPSLTSFFRGPTAGKPKSSSYTVFSVFEVSVSVVRVYKCLGLQNYKHSLMFDGNSILSIKVYPVLSI